MILSVKSDIKFGFALLSSLSKTRTTKKQRHSSCYLIKGIIKIHLEYFFFGIEFLREINLVGFFINDSE